MLKLAAPVALEAVTRPPQPATTIAVGASTTANVFNSFKRTPTTLNFRSATRLQTGVPKAPHVSNLGSCPLGNHSPQKAANAQSPWNSPKNQQCQQNSPLRHMFCS